jgi:purine nucleosidase
LDVVAITCVNGNTTIDNVVKNVSIITGVLGKKVPIYKGMERPIVKDIEDASAYHGTDGFGGVQDVWLEYADTDNIKKGHGANAIIKHVHEEHKNGNEIGVFTIGPLSNLGMAIRLDHSIIPLIDKFYCMGGTVNGWGNITLTNEFNFHCDPEAAKI